jgi:hypothetical protein
MWLVALYFGFGVMLCQFSHTYFSMRTYEQKQVRALEWLPEFSRKDPDSETSGPDTLEELHPNPDDSIHPLIPPNELKEYQWDPSQASAYVESAGDALELRYPNWLRERRGWEPPTPSKAAEAVARHLGLQATNLVYCYVLSVLYGAVAFLIVLFGVPSFDSFTRPLLLRLGLTFGLLLAFSFLFVGSSITEILIEATLVINSVAFISTEFLNPGTVFGLAQSADAAVLTIVLHWLTVRFSEDELSLGQLEPAIYVAVAFGYSELGFLYLVLPTF